MHRDVKPENILLYEGQAMVADFGIALALDRARERVTDTGYSPGTPEYMSPEQFWDTDNIDHRSDLYALGCVMYEMLAGAPPYMGSPKAVATKHLNAPIPHVRAVRAELSEAVDAALYRALAKEPADRFESGTAFLSALT